MFSDAPEVLVGCQHCQIVAYAQLSQEGIDRSDLQPASAATIPQPRRPDMIVAIRRQQGYGRKSVQNLIAVFWS
jgi:hypothetical protein